MCYRLLPAKLMRDWMELFIAGKPLYETMSLMLAVTAETDEEIEKQLVLNNADLHEYQVVMLC